MITFFVILLSASWILLISDAIFSVLIYNKQLARFYQIWIKDEFLTSNFLVMGGKERFKRLVTHNGMVFKKSEYKYALLPFVNNQYTNKDISEMSEAHYLHMCLELTKKISSDDQSDAE